MSDMRKTLGALTLAVLMASGQAFADQATLDALQAKSVPLTDSQAAAVAAADAGALPGVIADLAAAQKALSPTIVAASVCASPDLSASIVEQAVSAVPDQADAINALVALGCTAPDGLLGVGGAIIPATGIPSGGGGGGGSVSPN
jgi:hypothetical protein